MPSLDRLTRADPLPEDCAYAHDLCRQLSPETREADLRALFAEHGTVRSLRMMADVFTGACRGIGFIEMEGHEARAAIGALNGKLFKGRALKVNQERPREHRGTGRR